MSSTTYHGQQALDLIEKYNISKNAETAFKALGQFRSGNIDEQEMGKLVRLSPTIRASITETIAKCANVMAADTNEMIHCTGMIQSCVEILEIADRPRENPFPLLKLPIEVRRKIFTEYLVGRGPNVVNSYPKLTNCNCGSYVTGTEATLRVHRSALAVTSRRVRDELSDSFYKGYYIKFPCTCELLARLKTCPLTRERVCNVAFHWTGPMSHETFRLLAQHPALKRIQIEISAATTKYLTYRETTLAAFFGAQKPDRITDARGLEELLTIRGLDHVSVHHLKGKQAGHRCEADRANLEALLLSRLTLPKQEAGASS